MAGTYLNKGARLDSKQSEPPRNDESAKRGRTQKSSDLGSANGVVCLEQMQSPFFSKLPAELRLEIYDLAFGNNLFDFQIKPDWNSQDQYYMTCTKTYWDSEPDQCCVYEIVVDDFVRIASSLLTCRLMYNEAASFLYSANTFRIRPVINWSSWRPFQCEPLRQYFKFVRNLELVYWFVQTDVGQDDYEMLWDTLSKMPALRSLTLVIESEQLLTKNTLWKTLRTPLLRPIANSGMQRDGFDLKVVFNAEWGTLEDSYQGLFGVDCLKFRWQSQRVGWQVERDFSNRDSEHGPVGQRPRRRRRLLDACEGVVNLLLTIPVSFGEWIRRRRP